METMFCWQVKEKTKMGTCGRRAVRCERRLACRQAEKEELTRRGVKFYARDRKHVLRAKLDACLIDESCATSR